MLYHCNVKINFYQIFFTYEKTASIIHAFFGLWYCC